MQGKQRNLLAVGVVVLLLFVIGMSYLRSLNASANSTLVGRTSTATSSPTGNAQKIAQGFVHSLPGAVANVPTPAPTATMVPPTPTPPPHVTAPVAPPPSPPQPPPPTAITYPVGTQPLPYANGVRLAGRQLVDGSGKVIRLIGVNESHLEYFCTADHMQPADFQAMRSWGFDTVRFTLSSEYWNHCAGYQNTVKTVVANAESVGLYVILVLQWNAPFNTPYDQTHGGTQYPMPDSGQDVTFWRDLATTYRGDNRVLFDLLGEPHDISWSTWLNGGPVTVSTTSPFPIYPVSGTYQTPGMRALAQMIRGIGNNVIIISGNEYGYDLSGVAAGDVVNVSNVMYGTHPFDWPGKQAAEWDYNFGILSTRLPVIITEFGGYNCQTTYASQLITYANQHNMSWLAWNWGVGVCTEPNILATWGGEPTTPYGIYIQQQALAIYTP